MTIPMLSWLQQQEPPPVMVKIMPKSGDPTGLSDVLIGALGLTGVLILAAVLLAAVFAGILFFFRFKFRNPLPSASQQQPGDEGHTTHITR
jgi:hypothetical protein